jgi:hypothetical protein
MVNKHKKHSHRKFLKDLSKVLTGLVIADIVGIIWMLSSGVLPWDILGVQWTTSLVNLGLAFDIFLLLALVHYGWHPDHLEPTFSRNGLFIFIGIFTGLVAAVHIVRIAFGLPLILGSWESPMWLSWFGAIITVFISYSSFHFVRK